MPFELLAIRCAAAEDREAHALFDDEDASRPLTDDGREEMRASAAALALQEPGVERLASSPVDRALDTARIVAEAYGGLAIVEVPDLSLSASPIATLRWLRSQTDVEKLAVVGHEAGLSSLVSWLLVGSDKPLLNLEEGGVCLLDFEHGVTAGGGLLRWALTPAQLDRLGKVG